MFDSADNMYKAMNALGSKFKITRMKNRIAFLSDILINFRYDNVVAEMQFMFVPKQENKTDEEKE